MGTLLLILLIVLLLAAVFGGGGYTYRRYYVRPPATGDVVETEPASSGSPIGTIVALAVIALVLLFLIYGGFNFWSWFGGHSVTVR